MWMKEEKKWILEFEKKMCDEIRKEINVNEMENGIECKWKGNESGWLLKEK